MPTRTPMGSRSVTLREEADCSLAVWPLLQLLDEMLLLLLFSLLLFCGDVSLLLAVCCCTSGGRWATAVRIEVLAKSLASSRTWNVPSLLWPPTTERLSVTPPVRSARPSNVVPYFNASYEPCNLPDKKKTFSAVPLFWVIVCYFTTRV